MAENEEALNGGEFTQESLDGGTDPETQKTEEAAPTTQESLDTGGDTGKEGGKPESGGTQEGGKQEEVKAEDYTLSASEDFPIPDAQLGSFTETCKKAGLSKAQAEAVLDWHKGQYREDTAWRAQEGKRVRAEWDKAVLEDRDFGGTESNYKKTVAAARRALSTFDEGGALLKLLKETGAEFHPDVVKTLARIGRAMGEHTLVTGRGRGVEKPLEDRMYPDM